MKFFFADSVDTVDPDYDFIEDQSLPNRNRQYEDVYPHEILDSPPYDGILVSYSAVGIQKINTRYTQGQKQRLLREGAHEFFRLPERGNERALCKYPIMGDCGSFAYINDDCPPHRADEIFDFYEMCRFNYGVSPDHIISGKNASWDNRRSRPSYISERAEYTSQLAKKFFALCEEKKSNFQPIGSVQFWSPSSAAYYASKLVDMGYTYIGLGGLAYSTTQEIYNVVAEVRDKIPSCIKVHIFGFSRFNDIDKFQGLNVSSIDSTSPLLKAFKDDRHNYFSSCGKHYIAIKVPQLYESSIKNRIQSGDIELNRTSLLEKKCLEKIRAYSENKCDVNDALSSIATYYKHLSISLNNFIAYKRVLDDRPWEKCKCNVCREIGIEVVIYRGLNRNKRRGFHNLYIFHNKLKGIRDMKTIQVPSMKVNQTQKTIFSFVVNGKDIPKFASVSRIRRDEDGKLLGYQRPEVEDHIRDIARYLDKKDAILPNSIVIAFNKNFQFKERYKMDDQISMGLLEIPIDEDVKSGWIVDGQQRVAALRKINRSSFPVSVIAFHSEEIKEEREQFVLVNNTKPLPKSLVYELLPSISDVIPPKMKKRQRAYQILERMNLDTESPFHFRIKTVTSGHIEAANIKDVSVLKMIENSMDNGILNKFPYGLEKPVKILNNYWAAVKSYYQDAWMLPPRKSRLTHGAGIVSMGYLMDAMAYKLSEKWEVAPMSAFSQEMKILGDKIPWTNGTWQFSRDMIIPWDEIQNTSRHSELVTNYLIRRYKLGPR